MTIFVDTSIWFAAAHSTDRNSERAKAILRSATDPITSNFVLLETWLLLKSRLSWHAAETFADAVLRGIARLEPVTAADLQAARTIALQFSDQKFSLSDRTSFALMERLGITKAASLDADFAIYRYGRDRKRAFEVLN